MFADKALRCDCGYEVRASAEAACVDAVRQHAWEAHGIDLSVELALDVVRRAGPGSRGDYTETETKKGGAMKKRGSLVAAALLCALAAFAAMTFVSRPLTAAHATPTSATGCAQVDVMKTVFPKAASMGFRTRWRIARVGRRHPYFKGWCGNWATTYTDSRGAPEDQPLQPHGAFAEVRVSLYKTQRDALVALHEPAFGPIQRLSNGARMRTRVWTPSVDGDASRQVGGVASVVGNVFVSSQGQGRPPAYRGDEAVHAQIRIHRRIHAAVLRSAEASGYPGRQAVSGSLR